MAVWLIRAGKNGEDEAYALDKGYAIIGWMEVPDISGVQTYEEMKRKHVEFIPEMSPKAVINNAAQIWAFLNRIKNDDLVILPLKTRSAIAIGKITGNYMFFEGRHVRPVTWLRDNVPRSDFGQDLLYSFGAFMTICQITRNDAESRIRTVLTGKKDPALSGFTGVPGIAGPADSDAIQAEHVLVDLEEQALDQIRSIIEARFKGHDLARLIEALLNSEGYITNRSSEGPDGGVDIVAGFGPMGFEQPRLCVQVKSGGVQNDSAIRELEGVMSRVGAAHGLFVSWQGFNKSALQKINELFFKVRLWDDKKLMAALLANYDKLPEQLQAELPLKRIWVVVPDSE